MKKSILLLALLITFSACKEKAPVNSHTTPFSASDTAIILLKSKIPDIKTDVRYATTNNFTGKILYPSDEVYIRKIVADSLAVIQAELRSKGLFLKIFDAYRPLSVQKIMWAITPDTNFVADPAKGSRHNRGAAVDLTIVDSTGKELEMGTGYDDFTEKAHPDYSNLPDNVQANRKLLADLMIKRGFTQYKTEWWHFDFKNWEFFAVMDGLK